MTTAEAGDTGVPCYRTQYTEASRELDAIVGFFEQARWMSINWWFDWRGPPPSSTSSTGACARPGPRSRNSCPVWRGEPADLRR